MDVINIGINGFGRIGRALFRLCLERDEFNVVAINDIDADIDNHAYLLKYDTTYGVLQDKAIEAFDSVLRVNGEAYSFFNASNIAEVPWHETQCDIVIDASGVQSNVEGAKRLLDHGQVKKVVVTHAPSAGVDKTIIVGANESEYLPSQHDIISSSICDANAVAPFYKLVHEQYGVELAEVTTLHPWLQYQNLLDGSVRSVSSPGHVWQDYALGRSSVGSLIPKDTSLVNALGQVFPGISESMHASSFRTPTSIVSAADGVFLLEKSTSKQRLLETLTDFANACPNVLRVSTESLISVDYSRVSSGCIVDLRWLHLQKGRLLKFVLWYDNEWGYASKALDVVSLIGERG